MPSLDVPDGSSARAGIEPARAATGLSQVGLAHPLGRIPRRCGAGVGGLAQCTNPSAASRAPKRSCRSSWGAARRRSVAGTQGPLPGPKRYAVFAVPTLRNNGN